LKTQTADLQCLSPQLLFAAFFAALAVFLPEAMPFLPVSGLIAIEPQQAWAAVAGGKH